jgi:tetratricopeptide (TPR) repeat protein
MSRIFATSLLIILICTGACPQTSTNPPATNPTSNDSTSQQSQPGAAEDQPTQPVPPAKSDKKKSAAKRKLGELKPNCVNIFGLHTCSSSAPTPKAKPSEKDLDPEYARDMDVGDFYLNERRNYTGAMLRFRDALARKPNDPAATFKLAQSLEGLGQIDEAREQFQAYLKLEPEGQFAGQSNMALERLQSKSVRGIDRPKKSPQDSHHR